MDSNERHQWLNVLTAFYSASAVAASVLLHATPLYTKVPYHTSALSGAAWVQELLDGHPERIRCELGMHKHVFRSLITNLVVLGHRLSRNVSLEGTARDISVHVCHRDHDPSYWGAFPTFE